MADTLDLPILVLDLDADLNFICRPPDARDGVISVQEFAEKTLFVFARMEVRKLTWYWNPREDVSYEVCAPPDVEPLYDLRFRSAVMEYEISNAIADGIEAFQARYGRWVQTVRLGR